MLAAPLTTLLAVLLVTLLAVQPTDAAGNRCSASTVHWGPGTKQITIQPTVAPWQRRQVINIEKLCRSVRGVVAGVEVTACDTDFKPRIHVTARRVIITRHGGLRGSARVLLELYCAGRLLPATTAIV